MVNLARGVLIFGLNIFFGLAFSLKKKQPYHKRFNHVVELYSRSPFTYLFAKIRLWDAPFEKIDKYIPQQGTIIDLGCGDGLLVNYLALHSSKRKIIGIDLNKRRLEEADKKLPNTLFQIRNIMQSKLPQADAIILTHVLHHLDSYNNQELLIKKCFYTIKKTGILIIIEIVNKPFWKFLITQIADKIIVPILFNNKFFDSTIVYRNTKDWRYILEKYGFRVQTRSLHKNKPFSHILFICKRD